MIEKLENDIVAKLRTDLGYMVALSDIQNLPQTNEDFDFPMDECRITVGYERSLFTENVATLMVAQPEEVEFIVTIRSRWLRAHEGIAIYDLISKLKKSLLGYRPPNCTKPITQKYFGPPKKDFPQFFESVWTYEWYIQTEIMSVQDCEMNDVSDATLMDKEASQNMELSLNLSIIDPVIKIPDNINKSFL